MVGNQNISSKYSRIQPTTQISTSHEKAAPQRWSFNFNRSLLWMIVSLLSGVALAIGHHFFYDSFDGLQVKNAAIDQTWIIRIGTVFAFAVKTLLVIATSIAFVQQQWLALSHESFKIRQIDTITSVLGNALSFLESRIWLQFPLLTLLASIAWLLPITAVVTPATINVIPIENITILESAPPQLYFDPELYANLQTTARRDYVGPSPDTLRTAYGSAMTGQILPIAQAFPNMTYTLEFLGPALRCDHANDSFIKDVYDAYMESYTGIENQYRYFAWAPEKSTKSNASTRLVTDAFLDLVSTDAAHLYIIPNTSIAGPIFVGGQQTTPDDMHYGYQDLLDCKLYNASYRAFLNLTFPTQTIDVRSRELLNPVNVSTDISEWYRSRASSGRQAQRICYQSIMESFGRLLAGYEWWRDGYVTTEKTSWNMMAIDWTTRDGAQRDLERLFQNITLSMLATSSLIMNSTIAAQNRVPVDVVRSVNVYSYNSRDLWLAYGIGIGAALIATLWGLHAMWRNGGVGYRSTFSTFIRTTRSHPLLDVVETHDRGMEPLPKKLAETSIRLDT